MRQAEAETYWVYIAASSPRGVLYVGMTSDLAGRTWEHRERVMDGFTNGIGSIASFTSKRTTMQRQRRNASEP